MGSSRLPPVPQPVDQSNSSTDDPARRTFLAAASSADPLSALFGMGGVSITRPWSFALSDGTVIPVRGVFMGAAASEPYAYRVSDGGQTFDVFVRDVEPDGSFTSHGRGTLVQTAASS